MMKVRASLVASLACGLLGAVTLFAQQERPPAVPLVVHDPFFSLWSMHDALTDGPTQHWTATDQPMIGLARVDGKVFRYMGVLPRQYFALPAADAMTQVSLKVQPTHTLYVFEASGIRLHVTFFTPAFPQDLDLLSRPATYLTWTAESIDGKPHKMEVMLNVDPQIAVNDDSQFVTWGRLHAGNLTVLNVGSQDQPVLRRSGDKVREDWGYFHLIVPDGQQATTAISYNAIAEFARTGMMPAEDDMDMPKSVSFHKHAAQIAAAVSMGDVSSAPVSRHIILSYTDGYSIQYLGRKLRAYWQRNGMTEAAMFELAEKQYADLDQRGTKYDADLMAEMGHVGGKKYAYLAAVAYRQTLAAHKLVADVDGKPMFFSKENASNGCIDTVDVTYPSAPFFLLFNPKLLEAQLEPVLRYAALPRWKFPFAPHDLGTYPLADGQVYGGGEVSEDNQMPVEESGNLLILIAALEKEEGNWDLARTYWPQLQAWAAYLDEKGMDPENQLSTDDFSGHLAHNTNLSIKAIDALGAFAQIAGALGHADMQKHYADEAKSMATKWVKMADDGDHYRLAFDQPGTWSQKYNLVWDQLLHLNIFPPAVAQKEWAFYAKQVQKYGLPLDSRKPITKLDWEIWTATLTNNPQQYDALISSIYTWMNETQTRVPLTDFYSADTGLQRGFQARSVVGGIFIKALADEAVANKWRSMASK